MAELALLNSESEAAEERRTRRTVDDELQTINRVLAIIGDMDEGGKRRTLVYINDRYGHRAQSL